MTNDNEDLEYVTWMDRNHMSFQTRYEMVLHCHDCESTENLEFVDWIDNYLCPDCLEAELG